MKLFPRVTIPVKDEGLTETERHTRRQQTLMAVALERLHKPVYPGTIGGVEKASRRAKGKRQRLARKAHR
jgi:hypothetical protein